MPPPQKIRLGDLLIEQGLLTQEQLKASLDQQKATGRKLGRIFVDSGYVTEEGISQALARQLRVPFIDLRGFKPPDEKLLKLLSEAQARRFRALVLGEEDGLLRVGFADPTDLQTYDEVGRLVRREMNIAVVTESQLLALIDRVYRRTEEISGLAKELTAELGESTVDFGDVMGLTATAEDAPVVKLIHTVFDEAMRSRASDIHIEPEEKSLRIRFRIDGVLHIQTEADIKVAGALALRLKLMSGLDISEKRLPQDGRFNVKVRNHSVDIRISTLPTQYGESVVMRLLAQNAGLLSLDAVSMPKKVLEVLRRAIAKPSGIVLVTGPTGSGKTTTLYAALNDLNSPERKILTVEDPVEYRLPGINQVQVQEKIDLTFGRVLRAALRQDPDVILVGEMRDQETAEIGLRAAMTGHLVLSTLHTNDVLSTPIRLLDMGIPRYMVALSLQLVMAQRLVRVVCESCRQPHAPTPTEHAWLLDALKGYKNEPRAFKGVGCEQCNMTGYQGRTGVYEFLEMTTDIVDALNDPDPNRYVQVARRQMVGNTLRDDALRLVMTGRTTVDEAMRITGQVDD
ncbi:GspE/PulE family protein [Dechloromonas sp. ZY10]|uniref:GspE/PulE family protein n=1 Tax=Dechloromonas aquae TaxID=2664436 RepID=UPI00352714F0